MAQVNPLETRTGSNRGFQTAPETRSHWPFAYRAWSALWFLPLALHGLVGGVAPFICVPLTTRPTVNAFVFLFATLTIFDSAVYVRI